MPTFFSADCPRATDVFANRAKGIVFSFAEFTANRMDRGEVNDIEAHFMNEGQLFGGVLKSPMGFAVIDA